jgi:hypothetical protein
VQVNTRQQTERDVKRQKRKHGTIEQMCQVLCSIFFSFHLCNLLFSFHCLQNFDEVISYIIRALRF